MSPPPLHLLPFTKSCESQVWCKKRNRAKSIKAVPSCWEKTTRRSLFCFSGLSGHDSNPSQLGALCWCCCSPHACMGTPHAYLHPPPPFSPPLSILLFHVSLLFLLPLLFFLSSTHARLSTTKSLKIASGIPHQFRGRRKGDVCAHRRS